MTKWEDRQAGFGIVVVVVVALAIAALAGTGWVVYQRHKTGSKTTAETNSSQTASQQQSTTTTQSQQTAAQTLDVKEWGVHMTLDSTTASLYYYIGPQTSDVAYLSLRTVSNIAPACAADKTSLAAIGRLTEAEQQAIVSGTAPGVAGTIHIGSYWYSFSTPNAGCVFDSATQQAINKAQPSYDLNSVFKTLAPDSAAN